MNYTVYKHTNKTNNKVYIGITSRPPKKDGKMGEDMKICTLEGQLKNMGGMDLPMK